MVSELVVSKEGFLRFYRVWNVSIVTTLACKVGADSLVASVKVRISVMPLVSKHSTVNQRWDVPLQPPASASLWKWEPDHQQRGKSTTSWRKSGTECFTTQYDQRLSAINSTHAQNGSSSLYWLNKVRKQTNISNKLLKTTKWVWGSSS